MLAGCLIACTPCSMQLVDNAIQSCPIDTRRALYGNIVLSGGGTMFKNFGRRLGAELHTITGARLKLGATVRARKYTPVMEYSGSNLAAVMATTLQADI